MALVPTRLDNSLQDLGIDGSVESLGQYLDAQKRLFYSQVEQLQRLVVTQCKLTGVNPLSQEMAAGALSIKIGKKHRDMLNPKAVKYMQSVFAIKDTIGKKETREISALCGVTVTQVRDFFSGQRSKVRKLISFAREKAIRSDASDATNEGCPANPEAALFCRSDTPASDADIKNIAEVSTSNWKLPAFRCCENVPVSSIDAKPVQVTALSSSSQEECMLAMDEDDKKILENIFNLMWKEGTFSGQVKLMEWILQIHNSAVLVWFLTKGCIAILATWLSEAAIEEQTTVLNVILKVLCHLPLHKALPAQMSTILQTVNKLRFYRTQDISNRAKVLLSRWSKMLVRNHALKHPSSTLNSSNGVQKDIIRKQRINEILSDEFWRSKIGITEEILTLTENSGNDSKSDPKQAMKLLTASCDSPNKKHGQSALSIKIKERRKVLLVEQLDQKPSSGRFAQAGKAASAANHSRPLSADDIQKAKMRAMFMQHKYGKADSPSAAENKRTEVNKDVRVPQSKKDLPAPVIITQQTLVNREEGRPVNGLETLASTPLAGDLRQELSEMVRGGLLQWRMPPEIKLDSSWRVGEGESSKEIGIQVQRIRREKETFYSSKLDVPPNAKEPWDVEMDFDDSLTPEIPTQQLPDSDPIEEPAVPSADVQQAAVPSADVQQAAVPEDTPPALAAPSAGSAAAAPDLELLAILLQNPELVFALTSGQGRNLTSDERVALLDMIKHNNTASLAKEPHPVSLPSPTPPSDAERAAGWRTLAFSAAQTGVQSSAVTVNAATQILGSAPSAEFDLLSKNYGTACSRPAMASYPQDSYGRSRDTLLMRDIYAQASLSHIQEDELLLQSRLHGGVIGVYEDFYPTYRNTPTEREETAACRFTQSEAWSPEGANVRSSRFWQGQGRGNAEKWPRQQRSGFGGRWRDWDRNRDWDHRR